MTTRFSNQPQPSPNPLRHLLATYTTSHPLRSPSPLPPSSRVNPGLTQRLPPTSSNPLFWSFKTWITFFKFIWWKIVHIVWSLISHFLWGPARKSWGYRMTFIASVMRNVADHTSLADIFLIRRLVSLHILLPLPSEAVVTPVTFNVPRRQGVHVARGFIRDLDRIEDGRRELSGEWVMSEEVSRRMKRDNIRKTVLKEYGLPDDPCYNPFKDPLPSRWAELGISRDAKWGKELATGEKVEHPKERVIYYIHGGAYYVGNAATHRLITIGMSKYCNARVFAITYRLAPEHTFPLPLHDVFVGYLRLLRAPLNIKPENIVIAGDSAGGGLSLALCMYLRDEGYPMPAGLVLMSPWVDLTMSCGSWDENMAWDVVPRPDSDDHLNPVGCYLGPSGIAKYLTHPYASPLFGNFEGLPTMLIQSGDSEVLRDEITLLAHKATLAGVEVTHELYEDMVHVFQMFTFLPAARSALRNTGRWVRHTLPRIESEKLQDKQPTSTDVGEAAINEALDGARRVNEAGEIIGEPGRRVGTRAEVNAVRDQREREFEASHSSISSLQLDLRGPTSDQPSIDVDSLPRSASRSGSPTPTGSPVIRPEDPFSSTTTRHGVSAPPLRRALTSLATSTPATPAQPSFTRGTNVRRRRRTQGALSLHVSPAGAFTPAMLAPSNPVSPSPSIRMRLRSPSVSNNPSTRARSQSHSDIFNLVEGYFEGGAANETTVFAPGGQIRSVGVLGGEDEA